MKTGSFILILFSIATLSACSILKSSEDYNDQTPIEVVSDSEMLTDTVAEVLVETEEVNSLEESSPLITYERSYCFGMCPVFKSSVYADGRIEYEGINFVDYMGDHEGSMSENDLTLVISKLKEINYFDLDSTYDNPAVMDIPAVLTSAYLEGEAHQVYDRWRAPKELKTLYTLLDEIYSRIEWTPTQNNE